MYLEKVLVSLVSFTITVYHTFVRFIRHFIKFVKVFCWRFFNFGATLVNKIWRTWWMLLLTIRNQSNNNKSKPLVNAYSESIMTNQNRISQTITVYMHEIQLTFCCEVLVCKHFLKSSINLKLPLFSRDFLRTTKDR